MTLWKFENSIVYCLCFFNIFTFFFISPIYTSQKKSRNIYGVSLYGLKILSKNSWKFWIFLKKNRDITLVGSPNRCSISSWALLELVFYVGDLFLINVVYAHTTSVIEPKTFYITRTDVESLWLSTSPELM